MSSLTYDDRTVALGQTYFYTAVAADSTDSSRANYTPSNVITVSVPTSLCQSGFESLAYIANAGSASATVIATASSAVIGSIGIDTAAVGVTASAGGSRLYFANTVVTALDASNYFTAARISVGSTPFGIAASPQGTSVVVSNYDSNSISVIDPGTLSVLAAIPVSANPQAVAFSTYGQYVYVSYFGSNTVSKIDLATNAIVATIPVGQRPLDLGIVARGTGDLIYVANNDSGTVSVINAATNVVTNTITVGLQPRGIAIHPDGSRVYVTNWLSRSVSIIDTSSHQVIGTVAVGGGPRGPAVSPDGSLLYVPNSTDNTVSVVSTATNSVTATISGLSSPMRVAFAWGPRPSAITAPSAPTVATVASQDVRLSWGYVQGASRFSVWRSESAGQNGTRVYCGPDTTFADTASMTAGSTQYYRVRAGSSGSVCSDESTGWSAYSDPSANTVRNVTRAQAPSDSWSGWWWSPQENGRGYSIERKGSDMFVGAYMYAEDGTPIWYIATGPMTSATRFSASLRQFARGITLTGSYREAREVATVGTMTIDFTSPTTATMDLAGTTITIRRFDAVAQGVASSALNSSDTPQTGWWWNASESGRGFFIEIQGNHLFLAGFMYAEDGRAIWYMSSNAMTSTTLFQATLFEVHGGQALGGPPRPPSQFIERGTIMLRFPSPTMATLTLPNGGSVELTRFFGFLSSTSAAPPPRTAVRLTVPRTYSGTIAPTTELPAEIGISNILDFGVGVQRTAGLMASYAYLSQSEIATKLSSHRFATLANRVSGADQFFIACYPVADDSSATSPKCARASSTSRIHYVVSIRGTDQYRDWFFRNAPSYMFTDPFEFFEYSVGRVAQGFYALSKVVEQYIPVSVLNEWARGSADILITGHSLGGAAAELLGVTLISKDRLTESSRRTLSSRLKVITFGAPPSGDYDFYAGHNHFMNAERFVADSDPVPHLRNASDVSNYQLSIEFGFDEINDANKNDFYYGIGKERRVNTQEINPGCKTTTYRYDDNCHNMENIYLKFVTE